MIFRTAKTASWSCGYCQGRVMRDFKMREKQEVRETRPHFNRRHLQEAGLISLRGKARPEGRLEATHVT